jgi:glycosyltransferase involved in cell wall biosynthesis
MLAPIAWRVPPRHYGPWELVVSLLTEGLVAAGVDVTLFATGDSVTNASLVSTCETPYEEDGQIDVKVAECLHIATVFERASEFDVIHNHFDFGPLTYSRLVETPVVTTIHGFSSASIVPVYRRYDGHTAYVAVSNASRHPDLHYVATVYHGIAVNESRLGPGSRDGTLAFFGRIHPDKGTAEAIEVARRSGRPLVIAGIIQDRGYFEKEVEPHIDGDRVRYLGVIGREGRDDVLGQADALLHLVRFAEPFGLSMVEAMACGTPVIATPRGAVPEIIRDGYSGYLVQSPDDAVDAVARLADLDRRACRMHVRAHFTIEQMVDGYLGVYQAILG